MNALSVPGVSVNNIPIGIIPNSLKIKLGKGETNVRSASTGNSGVEIINTENAEDKVAMISFDMFVTDETISNVHNWKSVIGGNVVQAQQLGQAPLTMSQASMTNDPDLEASSDGKATIEFKGAPIPATT